MAKKYTGQKNIHKYYSRNVSVIDLSTYSEYYKFAVVREPVERFVSAYRNRILLNRDLKGVRKINSIESASSPPSINEFAMDLEWYIQRLPIVDEHFSPQGERLGHNLSICDEIFPMERLCDLEEKLVQIVGRRAHMPRKQTGGPKMGLEVLSREALEKLITFYEPDYVLLADYYAPDSFREKYYKSRTSKDS